MRGGLTGNLSKFWKSVSMELYIAGTLSIPYVYEKAMEVFLAGEHPVKNGKDADWEGLNILETYYYLQNNKEFPRLIGNFQNFLLDSGAFTFMSGAGVVNFDKYVEGYAAFIKKWNVKNFFELDIDSVVGIREVERLREKLERLSGRKPIPVWHKSRGKEYFVEMCKNYTYVAIGGIAAKEMPVSKFEALFPYMIGMAHKNGCKVHGLGYTKVDNLRKYRFDSIDSTTWTVGERFGEASKFENGSIKRLSFRDKGVKYKMVRDKEALTLYNFKEWLKFQHYADKNL